MARIIFHVDVNSAFLSWSAVYRLKELGEKEDLRLVPSIVGGDEESRHGIVLAKSTPAKKYGIETAEPVAAARRKCPGLVVVPSDFSVYRRYSADFMAILRSYSEKVIQYSIDEAWVVFDGYESIYGDMVEFAYKLKDEIKERLGFTVNIGVSDSFLLAKMAGDFSKPDKVHTLFPDEIEKKMWPLPISDLLYAGKSMTKAMRNLGILTIGDLAHFDRKVIDNNFGKFGLALWGYANGEDIEPESWEEMTRKGYGHSTTTAENTEDMETAREILLNLSESLASRLRKDGVKAYCITVSVRYADFTHISKQKTLDDPISGGVEICNTAMDLLKTIWHEDRPIRQLGVRATKVTESDYHQMTIFDITEEQDGAADDADSAGSGAGDGKITALHDGEELLVNREKAEESMDELRKRFGKDIIKKGSQL